jgi:hypothetical protein
MVLIKVTCVCLVAAVAAGSVVVSGGSSAIAIAAGATSAAVGGAGGVGYAAGLVDCAMPKDYKTMIANYEKELKSLKETDTKMGYFTDIIDLATEVTCSAMEEADSQRNFEEVLQRTI